MSGPAFIVVGYGRSGTQYMAKLMQHFGYRVGHERRRDTDGVSAMDALPASKASPGLEVSRCEATNRLLYKGNPDTKLIHVVRNPWDVVESDFGRENGSVAAGVSGWYPHIKKLDGITRVIRALVFINETIAALTRDLVVRVEEAPGVVGEWLAKNELSRDVDGDPPSTTVGHKEHRTLSPEDWGKAGDETMDALKAHCRLYGYSDKRA